MGKGRTYSEEIYNNRRRQWFGLAPTHITFNETEKEAVKRWYPEYGPVKILKVGCLIMATMGKGEEEFIVKRNSSELAVIIASTTGAPGTISSSILDTQYTVDAGSYITILASTNGCSTGSVALFIDYVPAFTGDGDRYGQP